MLKGVWIEKRRGPSPDPRGTPVETDPSELLGLSVWFSLSQLLMETETREEMLY